MNTSGIVVKALANGWVVLGLGTFLVSYYIFFEPMSVAFHNAEMWDVHNNPKTVFKRGEPIFMHRTVCKSKNVIGVVDRELRSVTTGAIYPLDRIPSGTFSGCQDRTVAIVPPPYLPPGDYIFQSRGTYMVNPLRSYTAAGASIPFTITE